MNYSIITSILALIVSITVAWITIFRRGILKMTKPAFVAFCYDIAPNGKPMLKIFIRALLYSTGKRGNVIENMYLIVRNNDNHELFNIWGYGEEKLSRGSGMFVGETGVAVNHHFNPLPNSVFEYLPGNYNIQVFATLPGHNTPIHIQTVDLKLEETIPPNKPETAMWFDWQPDKNDYHAHLETRGKTILHT